MSAYRSVTVDGENVFDREASGPGARALLLSHAYPSSSGQCEQLMRDLAVFARQGVSA